MLPHSCMVYSFYTRLARKHSSWSVSSNFTNSKYTELNMLHSLTKLCISSIHLTISCIATVAEITHRSPCKLIHKKSVAFLYLDIRVPVTTSRPPVETHLSADNLPDDRWMRSAQPTRCMSSAVLLRNTGGRHHSACCPCKSVPFWRY